MISVITIFFNGDRFIAEAIESVVAQTYQDWELILVDDGSTDRATAIAREFAARYPDKIRYFEHPGHANRGMSASRNLGLEYARGKHISYLDAEDVLRPDKLEDQMRLLKQNPRAAYVFGPLELWRSWTGRPSDVDEIQDLGVPLDRVIEPPELLKLFLRNRKNIPSGVFVRAKTFDQQGGYEPAFTGMYEDLVMHAKVCLSQPVYVASKSWYRYRQHPDSCDAQAWRTGRDRETRLTFLRWLENYLAHQQPGNAETLKLFQRELRGSRPSILERLSGGARRQARRAQRLVKKGLTKTRRALSPPPIILCYHRVLEPEMDPHLLAVSAQHFREQLAVLQRLAKPLSLDGLSDSFSKGAPAQRGVVLTFDDGYLDNLENALPILKEFGIPATIYIATGYVGTDGEFWWDDLERLILGAGELPAILRLRINGRTREWELGKEAPDRAWNVLHLAKRTARQNLFIDLHAALRPLAEPLQREVLEQLRGLTGLGKEARPLYRCVSVAELQTLAAEPLITLGAHTITHCDLDYRTKEEQQIEIGGSKRNLEGIIGRSVAHFSYPYGSFNAAAVAVCAENQFRSAVTCIEEPVERKAPRHRWPRFLVRDWSGPEFERQLSRYVRG